MFETIFIVLILSIIVYFIFKMTLGKTKTDTNILLKLIFDKSSARRDGYYLSFNKKDYKVQDGHISVPKTLFDTMVNTTEFFVEGKKFFEKNTKEPNPTLSNRELHLICLPFKFEITDNFCPYFDDTEIEINTKDRSEIGLLSFDYFYRTWTMDIFYIVYEDKWILELLDETTAGKTLEGIFHSKLMIENISVFDEHTFLGIPVKPNENGLIIEARNVEESNLLNELKLALGTRLPFSPALAQDILLMYDFDYLETNIINTTLYMRPD